MIVKKLVVAVAALGLLTSVLYAGGPVKIEDDVEVVAEKPATSSGVLIPLLLLAVIGVAIASGEEDTGPQPCLPLE